MSEEHNDKQEISKVGRMEIPTALKNLYLLTSKQLNPKEDPSLQLLGKFFDLYKSEMTTVVFKLFLDVLGCDTDKLVNLRFNSLQLDDKQAKFLCVVLAYCLQLESLELSSCNLTDKGLTYIVKGLVHIPGLTKLDLSFNQFTSASLQYLTRGLHYTHILEYLNLSGLKIQESDLHLIEEILKICSFLACFKLENLITSPSCIAQLTLISENYKCKNFIISLQQDPSTQLLE